MNQDGFRNNAMIHIFDRKIWIPLVVIVGLGSLAIGVGLYYSSHDRTSTSTTTTSTTASRSTTTLALIEPTLSTQDVLNDLNHPWEIVFLPDGTMLFTERSGELNAYKDSQVTQLATMDGIKTEGEGGLLGLAVDTDFKKNRFVYTCFNTSNDVRIVRYSLNRELTKAFDPSAIVTGLPSKDSGRHSGCRLSSAKDGTLFIGTGDAAKASNPQSPRSLGGKILHVDRDGNGVKGNMPAPFDPRVFNYGHRNIQGIALFEKPKNGVYGFSVEHGSDVDDEVNLIKTGNFGWSPTGDYDESVPMTDLKRFPEAVSAIWSSGDPTIAPSGATFLTGSNWGTFNGCLAMAVLKAERLKILCFDDNFQLVSDKDFITDKGRIRAATLAPDGNLYIATDKDNGQIIRVIPN